MDAFRSVRSFGQVIVVDQRGIIGRGIVLMAVLGGDPDRAAEGDFARPEAIGGRRAVDLSEDIDEIFGLWLAEQGQGVGVGQPERRPAALVFILVPGSVEARPGLRDGSTVESRGQFGRMHGLRSTVFSAARGGGHRDRDVMGSWDE